MTTQSVVYRFCQDGGPKWQFYSMPESILGGADTLASAKARYREALSFTLDVEPDELPAIREFTEREIYPSFWVRVAQDAYQVDRGEAFDVLRAMIASQSTSEIDSFFNHVSGSGDVIAIPCEPTDNVEFVLNQITDHDAVWIVANSDDSVAWLALGGSEAVPGSEDEVSSLGELGFTRRTLIVDLLRKTSAEHRPYALACVPA